MKTVTDLHFGLRVEVSIDSSKLIGAITMKYKFDAIFYYVSDLKRAVPFYTDVLGFELHSQDCVARFYIGDVLFELVPTSDNAELRGGGNARLCLEVEQINEAISELRSRGVAAEDADAKENGLLSSFRDPDGNEICLWQYTSRSA